MSRVRSADRVIRRAARAWQSAGPAGSAKYYLAPRALLAELRHIPLWRLRMRYYGGVPGGAGYLRVVPTSAEFLRRP